ncbi:disease resistance protein RPM1-like [Ziziphus jujuba]|uniref:Disease resistance protein RPM1-like n=1 Tax=Ziziphus jujuba TaxID=326968 RepID=A0ABM4AEA9_ZIZJJ|nr:disease resistance protein RPM1-like [Ziziphus jujuba]
MAETAVGFAIDRMVSLLTNETSLLRDVHSEVASITHELEAIQCFLKDADMKADLEYSQGDHQTTRDGVKAWVKQLTEIAFQIEDVIDEYTFHLEQHPGGRSARGFIASLCKVGRSVIKLKPRHNIASRIQEIKKAVVEIKERSARYGFDSIEKGTTNADNPSQYVSGYDPRKGSMYLEDDDVVGIESPRDELVGWLLNNDQHTQRAVISVGGMGGLGKTTLARKVYDLVKNDFDCHAWIAVSQSYQKEGLLKKIIKQFCKGNKEPAPQGIDSMDEEALTEKVRQYLQKKRYAVFFDDVWKVGFWGDIEHALLDNKIGGRIVITTRSKEVGDFCKISSSVYDLELKPLDPEKAYELFCKRAFRVEFGGRCPPNLNDLSRKIVKKCGGLPLAIVAIAGLLSTKDRTVYEWDKLHSSLSSELESNPHLTSITRILLLSYYDLPYYLKCCFLYFGMYPEDYSIKLSRLLRQWIAEGFIKSKKDKTLEGVAHQYLSELIHRSLVQISDVHFLRGTCKACRVHDLLHEVILKKMEDLSFCRVLSVNDQSTLRGDQLVTRRLSISNSSSINVLHNIDQSFQVRSILNFKSSDRIFADSILSTLTKNFKLLKLLDFEDSALDYIHEDIGNLFHLRYLSLRNTKVKMLPKSIGKLVNLETLDIRDSFVVEIPAEIKRVSKLRYLLAYSRYDFNIDSIQFNLSTVRGMKVHEGIGCLGALQK